jgi:putative heme-binding domain-containing protein
MAGGMDNPVEVIFTPGGERIFTTTFLQHPAGGFRDGLIHAIYGGVYGKVHKVLDNHPRTGGIMPVLTHLGAAAPCGLARLESDQLGEGYRNSVLACSFNMHKITRHVLVPKGASFETRDEDFLVSDNLDFHPTEVLEDADGSLLVIDMGAWFNYGCPTSKIAKPEVQGSIYRVRRTDAPAVQDPWGRSVKWDELSEQELVERLDDPRPRVRDKAITRLVKRGAVAVPVLATACRSVDSVSLEARRNSLWALARIEYPTARAAVREALGARETSLRHVALHSVALERDAEALPVLSSLVVSDEPPLRLKAAEALGRIGRPAAVPALLEGLRQGATDRFLEHALIYALIQIGDRTATLAALTDSNPNVRRAGLIALDQMKGGKLTRELVVPLLDTDDPELQQTALEVISQHEGWSGEIVGLVEQWLATPHLSADRRAALTGALIALSGKENIQLLVAEAMENPKTTDETRLLLLEVMARCRLDELPQRWRDALRRVLTGSSVRLRREAVATVRSRNLESFDAVLADLSRDAALPAELRIAAMECIVPRRSRLPADAFALLKDHLRDDIEPLLRASAARALGGGRLDERQLVELADPLGDAGSLIVPLLLPAYQESQSSNVGMALVAALKRSAGAAALTPDDMNKLLKSYPPEVHSAAKPLLDKLVARREEQAAYLSEVKLRLLRTKGNPQRGRRVFFSKKAACAGCHRMEDQGGIVGPELSHIGRLRSSADLVEAVIFPSSSIALGYEPYTIATNDGRVHSGIIVRETSDAVYLRTAQLAEIRIPRGEVDEMNRSHVSIMPQGLEKSLNDQDLSDLLEFLYSLK